MSVPTSTYIVNRAVIFPVDSHLKLIISSFCITTNIYVFRPIIGNFLDIKPYLTGPLTVNDCLLKW